MQANKLHTIEFYDFIWQFTPEAVAIFEEFGIESEKGFRTFALKMLSRSVLKEGLTELDFFGIGLRVYKEGREFTVDALENNMNQ
jgi:hypothetical protein